MLHVVARTARCAAGPGVRIPSFAYPEQAAIALAHATELGVWRAKPEGTVPTFDVREDLAAAVIADALTRGEGGSPAGGSDPPRLLRGAQRATGAHDDARGAADAAASFDGTVALKAIGPIHKTESGAVVLDLLPADVRDAATAMAERRRDRGAVRRVPRTGDGAAWRRDARRRSGRSRVRTGHRRGGGRRDRGVTRDVAVRVAPLTDLDAHEMVRSLATFPLLDGFRGAEPADVAALTDVVLRLGAIATTHDAITEMDCNPVIVHTDGAVVVDARISVQTPRTRDPFGARAKGDSRLERAAMSTLRSEEPALPLMA